MSDKVEKVNSEYIPYHKIILPTAELDESLINDKQYTQIPLDDMSDIIEEETIIPGPSTTKVERKVAVIKGTKDIDEVVKAAQHGFQSSSDEDEDEKEVPGEADADRKKRENNLREKIRKITGSLEFLDKHKPSDIVPTVCPPYNVWAKRFRSTLRSLGFSDDDLKLSQVTKIFLPCILPKLPPEMHHVLQSRTLYGVLNYLQSYDESHKKIIDQMRQTSTIKIKPTMAFAKFLSDLKSSYMGVKPEDHDKVFVQMAWEMVLDRLPSGLRSQYPLNVMSECPDVEQMKHIDVLWQRFVKNQPSKVDTSLSDKIDNVNLQNLQISNVPNSQSRPAQRGGPNFIPRGRGFQQQNFPNRGNRGFQRGNFQQNFRQNWQPRGNFQPRGRGTGWNYQPNWQYRGNFRPRGQNFQQFRPNFQQFRPNFRGRGNFISRGGIVRPNTARFQVFAPNPQQNMSVPNNMPNARQQQPPQNSQLENDNLCYYHRTFGNAARNCDVGCKYYSTWQASRLNY